MNRKEVKKYQFVKLKALLVHAYENVPFYRKRMIASEFKPNLFSDISNLDRLPCLTRDDLQNYSKQIFALNYNKKKLIKGSSSGSTGVPITYFIDSNASSAGIAAAMIGWGQNGWQLGDKGLHLWGNPTVVKNEWKRPMSRVKAKLYNHHKFPAFQLTKIGEFQRLIRKLQKEKYLFLDGYTNAIYMLADYIKKNQICFHRLKFIFTTGENLLDYQRDLIEEVLGPVLDMYGCSEINGIANECSRCGQYHVIDPHVFVEYGAAIGNDGTRELIVTDLDNFGFPLVRYKNGDLVVPSCENTQKCVFPYASFKKIVGRQSDIVRLPGGGILSVPSFFGSMLLKKIKGIKQYQVIRTSESHITIKLALNSPLNSASRLSLNNAIDDYLSNALTWDIQIVESIPVSKTGKFKLLIDKTANDVA
jgi:phenylacetate-CoA ligase